MIETDARLRNWARCYRDGGHRASSPLATQMLRGARAEMPPFRPLPDDPAPEPVARDERDAELVERALCSQSYPERHRLLICAVYLHPGRPVSYACSRSGIKRRHFSSELERALALLAEILRTVDFDNKK